MKFKIKVFLIFLILVNGCGLKKKLLPLVNKNKKLTIETKTQPQQQPYYFCPLDGEKINYQQYINRPLGVMIENHPRARPQAGLSKACLIYEALAEGGITRFLAFFIHNESAVVGPIRSARPYFVYWDLENYGVYVNCGQSFEAFKLIAELNLPTINQMWRDKENKIFYRDRKRKAPHNLYSSTYKLRKVVQEKNWNKHLSGFKFLFYDTLEKNLQAKPATEVIIKFKPFAYRVNFVYNKNQNSYLRFEEGKIHYDALTGKQLQAKNIIIQFVDTTTTDSEGRLNFELLGEGKAFYIRQNEIIAGKWIKQSYYSPTAYLNDKNSPVPLLSGQTWIEVLPYSAEVTVKNKNGYQKIKF